MEEDLANFLEDFLDFLNGLEASIVKMKEQIAKLVGAEPKFQWNPAKIKWEKSQGAKGEFEKVRILTTLNSKLCSKT